MTFEQFINAHPEGNRRQAFEAGVEEGRSQRDKALAALSHLKAFMRLARQVFEETATAAEKEPGP